MQLRPDAHPRGDRVVLVVGGDEGVGAKTAVRAAEHGWGVAVGFLHDRAAAQRVVDEIAAGGGWAMAVQADVADEGAVKRLYATTEGHMAPPLAVVNGPGLGVPHRRLDQMSADRLQRTLAAHAFAVLVSCREAVKRLSTRNGGRGGTIVNVVADAEAGDVDLAAAVGAVGALSVALDDEVRGEGVRVACVHRSGDDDAAAEAVLALLEVVDPS